MDGAGGDCSHGNGVWITWCIGETDEAICPFLHIATLQLTRDLTFRNGGTSKDGLTALGVSRAFAERSCPIHAIPIRARNCLLPYDANAERSTRLAMFANIGTIAFDAGWHGPQAGHQATGLCSVLPCLHARR